MKIAIVVSSITKGSGLSKYICSLLRIVSTVSNNILIVTTHGGNPSEEQDLLSDYGEYEYANLAGYCKPYKYFKIIKILRSFKPDVLFLNYNGVAQYILPFLQRSIKKIHVLHNDTDDFYRIGSINAKYIDGWIAPTEGIANNFNKYTNNKYKDKVVVIPHGIESNECPIHFANDIAELVFVGVLYVHKGVCLLPKIIEKLKVRGIKFHFTIIGGGYLEEELKTLLKDDIDHGIVGMTGVISSKEVYDILAKSDIFIYPTHIDAFGLVIAEAMISGVVPVVTLLPGITDNLVDDSQCGYLIPMDDVDGFVDKTIELIENPEKLEEMKLLAKKKAETCFSFSIMEKNYIDFITK